MEKGQRGSSDKKKRDESPVPEDDHKCRVCRFPLLIALLQLLLGVAVTTVAFLMLAVSPSLLAREAPHWAGIIVSSVLKLSYQTLRLHVCMDNFCMRLSCYPSRCRPSLPAKRSQPDFQRTGSGKSVLLLHPNKSPSLLCIHLSLRYITVTRACSRRLLFLLQS